MRLRGGPELPAAEGKNKGEQEREPRAVEVAEVRAERSREERAAREARATSIPTTQVFA